MSGKPLLVRSRGRRRLLAAAAVLALLFSLATVEQPGLIALSAASWALSLLLGLSTAAWTGTRRLKGGRQKLSKAGLWLRSPEGLVATALVLLGACLRLYELGSYPTGLNGDESEFTLLALAVLRGEGPHPFGTAFLGDPALYTYALAPFVALFGPSVAGMRVFGALCGVVTLPALYLLARHFFGARPALLALTVLAGSAAHVHFSRLTLNVPQVTLLFCLAAYALHRATVELRSGWWYAAGLLGALPVYFHFAGRLWPAVMGVYFAYLLLVHRGETAVWLRGAGFSLLGGLMVLSPLMVHLGGRPEDFTGHLSGRLIFNLWPQVTAAHGTENLGLVLARQLGLNLLGFVSLPDGSNFFYTFAGLPLLFPLLAPAVLAAVFVMLARGRDTRYGLLSAWFWTFMLVGTITNEPPQAHRLVNVLPALAVVLGVVLLEVSDWARRQPGQVWSRGMMVAALTLPLLAGIWDNINYFGRAAAARPWEEMTVFGTYAASLGSDHRLYSLGAPYIPFDHGNRRLLAPDLEGGDVRATDQATLANLPRDRELVLVVFNWNEDSLAALHQAFPEGREEAVRGPSGRAVFTAIRIPAE
ncbi:MAG: ArnT family glycosyltransferase [Chloroflexota bacterium]